MFYATGEYTPTLAKDSHRFFNLPRGFLPLDRASRFYVSFERRRATLTTFPHNIAARRRKRRRGGGEARGGRRRERGGRSIKRPHVKEPLSAWQKNAIEERDKFSEQKTPKE